MEIKRFNNIIDFYNFNREFIEVDRMLNVFLIRKIDEVYIGETRLYECFNIISNNAHVAVLLITDMCLIYSNQIDEELIPILSKEVGFHRFLRYIFAGNKQTIESLLNYNNAEYSIQKHLIFYSCSKTSSSFKYANGKMELAGINALDTLIKFNIFFRKEYNAEEVSYEEAKNFILSGIQNKNLYVWKVQSQLCALAQVIIKEENDFPEIGHVYTESKLRNNGFAPSLVHRLTNSLLDSNNQKCMLYTDGTNVASNTAFTKIGYVKTGEYIMCYKEK